MLKGLFIMNKDFFDLVYPPEIKAEIETIVNVIHKPLSTEEVLQNKSLLHDVDVIFSGWDGPKLDDTFLESATNLKVMFYGAGSIRKIATPASWEKGIVITTANTANAVPVAEYTLSQVLFALKSGWSFVQELKAEKQYPQKPYHHIAGAFNSTVGLISLSTVGRLVNKLLQMFDVNVLAYDPFVDEKEAHSLGVEKCSLDEIFKRSDVVSLHAPLTDDTRGMIGVEHFASMKNDASFINTARGAIVREQEMIGVLQKRPDLTAILDVVYPEPPEVFSPLYTLPNVALTPHIAGSEGPECGRLGKYMLDELKRYQNGESFKWQAFQN